MSYKGRFKPRNPSKYDGDPTNIIYRSSWELRCMNYFDLTDSIIEWSSEELWVPYKSPIDGRFHRYFPDFVIKTRNKKGKIETQMIEVKPESQTKPPKIRKKMTRRYINEIATYSINTFKWEAARHYCKEHNWKFVILTEKELGI